MNSSDLGVVVVAYGPSSITKNAARRARSLAGVDGTVIVVPASDFAAGYCRNIPAKVSPARGTQGVLDALDSMASECALVMHDDVHLSVDGLRSMQALLSGDHRFIVPFTNDVGMDHFGGSLPPLRAVTDHILNDRSVKLSTAAVRTVRPVCVFARRSDLLSLAERHLVEPNLRIDDIDLGFHAAPALAAHAGSCVDALVPTAPLGDEALLVAALIVRDEEETLPDLFTSINPLVDRIEVCDTGSVDSTVELAMAEGANVIHREWRDDFGWARNEVLAECRDAAYVLMVDADDRVRCPDPARLRRYLSTYRDEYQAFELLVESPDGEAGSSIFSVRIARADRLMYEGAVHERPVWSDDPLRTTIRGNRLDLLSVFHIGYMPEISTTKSKAERNLRIAKAEYDRDPNFKSAVEYARSLLGAERDRQLAVALLREAYAEAEKAPPSTRAYVGALLAQNAALDGNGTEAWEYVEEAAHLVPADDMVAAAAAYAAEALGEPCRLLDFAERFEGRPSLTPLFDAPSDRLSYDCAVVMAAARAGELEMARDRLLGLLGEASFEDWNGLLVAVSEHDDVADWLAPIVRRFPNEAFFPWVSTSASASQGARLCVEYFAAGGVSPEVALYGTVSAMVAGIPDAIVALAPHLGGLDQLKRERIADEAQERGYVEAADLIRRASAA